MTEQATRSQVVHRWYTRPVFFVADVNRAVHFYVDMLASRRPGIPATAPERSAR